MNEKTFNVQELRILIERAVTRSLKYLQYQSDNKEIDVIRDTIKELYQTLDI